jgi:hypothetical protein
MAALLRGGGGTPADSVEVDAPPVHCVFAARAAKAPLRPID